MALTRDVKVLSVLQAARTLIVLVRMIGEICTQRLYTLKLTG